MFLYTGTACLISRWKGERERRSVGEGTESFFSLLVITGSISTVGDNKTDRTISVVGSNSTDGITSFVGDNTIDGTTSVVGDNTLTSPHP